MKQILVPIDFSKSANNALDFAVQSAKILPAEITLLHSFEVNGNMYTDYMGVNKEFTLTLFNEANEKLADLKQRIKKADGVVVDTLVSKEPLQEAIKTSIKEKAFDLVIMGTLGASGLKEKLWGSRTSAVIGKSAVPVMVIPIDYKWEKPKKVLLATNQFEKEPAILNYLFELAGLYMASVQVAVFTDEDDDKALTFVDHKNKIAEYDTFLKDTYKEDALTSTHLYGEEFEDSLQDFIKENDIDLLVMVTYQQRFWNRIFNPSKTKRMSYHTNIPLLAIPAT
ncbi:MAG: universal stress protein [Ginsengibacter sp.]